MKSTILVLAMLLCLSSSGISQETETTYTVRLIKPKPSNDLLFEDLGIRIRFVISSQITFRFENKTTGPVEIDWSRASFIDTEATAHSVIHEGVRYVERDRAIPVTVVPPGANISDTILPADRVNYDSNSMKWRIRDTFKNLEDIAGETFGVLLPVKIRGITKNYLFSFKVVRGIRRIPAALVVNLRSDELKQTRITQEEFGKSWPFRAREVTLSCTGEAVFAVIGGEIYQITYSEKVFRIDNKIASKRLDTISNDSVGEDRRTFAAVESRGRALCY